MIFLKFNLIKYKISIIVLLFILSCNLPNLENEFKKLKPQSTQEIPKNNRNIFNNSSDVNSENGSGFIEAIGKLDPDFNGTGKVITPIGESTNDIAFAMTLQPDGKIIIVGHSNNRSNDDFLVVRYNSDGSLDSSFNGSGKVITSIGSGNDSALAVTLQPDGKILVAGYSYHNFKNYFAVVRYNPDGSLDNSFDTDGIVITDIGTSYDYASAIALQSNGKIIVAGYSYIVLSYDFAVVRYNPDGSLDPSFGSDGKITTYINSNTDDKATAVVLQPDGKILVAGFSNGDLVVVRYNPDGSLDNSFNMNGIATTHIGSSIYDQAYALALQPDGNIIIAGYIYNTTTGNNDFAVVRYLPNGSLDNSFDTDGIVITDIGTGSDYASAIALQPNGKIVVAGYTYNSTSGNYNFVVVRYLPNGLLDPSFNETGKVITNLGTMYNYATAIALQSNGKIIIAGYIYNTTTGNNDFAVIRYR